MQVSSNRPRFAITVALLVVAISMVALGVAGPAKAAICDTVNDGFTHRDSVAAVSFTATKDCSNHTVHVRGTLADTLCDKRSVRLDIRYDGGTFGNDRVDHSGGCNTSRTFDEWAGADGRYVQLCLVAWNANPFVGSSYRDCRSFNF